MGRKTEDRGAAAESGEEQLRIAERRAAKRRARRRAAIERKAPQEFPLSLLYMYKFEQRGVPYRMRYLYLFYYGYLYLFIRCVACVHTEPKHFEI